jgi:tetratricopeptide (TPR) repeat protein
LEQETHYRKGLDSFLESQKLKKKKLKSAQESEIVTETLALLYIKQGMVDKAIEVYTKLLLKNPEKSTYFATQIQKLKK